MAKPKIKSTTQDFTEVVDIIDDVVLFKGKRACMVMEVSSINFFLLSADEQSARVYGYMSLVNSLSFAIQILIVSKRVDIRAYLKTLDQRIATMKNPKIKEHLTLYRNFIQELVREEGLLDKKIYIVIPYSYLESGPVAVASKKGKKESFAEQAQAALFSKRGLIASQIQRMGLSAKPLTHEELIKLYYESLNGEQINLDFNSKDIRNVIL